MPYRYGRLPHAASLTVKEKAGSISEGVNRILRREEWRNAPGENSPLTRSLSPAYVAGNSEAKGGGSGKREQGRVNMYHSQSAGTKAVRLI